VWNILYTKFKEELQLALATTPESEHAKVEEQLYQKFSGVLGDRIRSITFGGAPTSKEVKHWLYKVFKYTVVTEGYGTTEAGGIASNGVRISEVEIKLVGSFRSIDVR